MRCAQPVSWASEEDNWGDWNNTDDEQYCWPARYCEDLSTKDAIDNSYARFAQEIFNISL